jgi:acyl-CoA reductase-like NAD-dependent aldehyde dehydrogenase
MAQQLMTSPIPALIRQQREFFRTGQTQAISFRLEQLAKLKQAIIDRQEAILQAAKADLGRPAFEAYFEIATLVEINLALKNLKTWAKPQRVKSPIDQFPASAWIQPDPLGVVLILSPWNYPFALVLTPLIGAIAAGNCVIIKPSEMSEATSALLTHLINENFSPQHIRVIQGGVETSQSLLAQKFDHIFFTGSTRSEEHTSELQSPMWSR